MNPLMPTNNPTAMPMSMMDMMNQTTIMPPIFMPPPPPPLTHLPPSVNMASGPQHPIIFMGHILSHSNGANKSRDAPTKIVQEIYFGCKVRLEGFHIVPNQISPPGMSFTGRTKPDLQKGPFTLELYTRSIESGEICSILSLSVSGGVQWMPIPPEKSELQIDYMAFDGTFEELSIIIHGYAERNADKSVEEDAIIPYPRYLDYLTLDEVEGLTNPTTRSMAETLRNFQDSKYDVEDTLADLNNLDKRMSYFASTTSGEKRPLYQGQSTGAELLDRVYTYRATSLISVEAVGDLVVKVFSIESGSIDESNIEKFKEQLKDITASLQQCWKVRLIPANVSLPRKNCVK